MNSTYHRIPVAVSACLMGQKVRYDGRDKHHARLAFLLEEASLLAVPLCPEVAIGLGVPRPPLALVTGVEGVRVQGVGDLGLDVTDVLERYALQVAAQKPMICGMVCKSRSPSCGLAVVLCNRAGQASPEKVQGGFIHALRRCLPDLPVIEETDLDDSDRWRGFLSAVRGYARSR